VIETRSGFSPRTHKSYFHALIELARYCRRSPDQLSNEGIPAFLVHVSLRVSKVCRLRPRHIESTAALSQGEHTFRLTLSGRRDEPDKYYALWFDAIGLRPAGEELK